VASASEVFPCLGLPLCQLARAACRVGARWQNEASPKRKSVSLRRLDPITITITDHEVRRSRFTITKSHGEAGVHDHDHQDLDPLRKLLQASCELAAPLPNGLRGRQRAACSVCASASAACVRERGRANHWTLTQEASKPLGLATSGLPRPGPSTLCDARHSSGLIGTTQE
jgi:hypothetical protein